MLFYPAIVRTIRTGNSEGYTKNYSISLELFLSTKNSKVQPEVLAKRKKEKS